MAKWLTEWVAFPLVCFLRQDLGYRVVSPIPLLVVNGLLIFLAVLAVPYTDYASPAPLVCFALLSFAVGLGQRTRRWKAMNRGVTHHSYYYGTSPFERLPLPAFLKRNRRAGRFLDPLFGLAVGFVVLPFSHPLGVYLVAAAFCLRAFESEIFEKKTSANLDMVDGIIAGQCQAEAVEQFETGGKRTREAGTPVSSGIDEELKALIKKLNN